MWPGKFWAIKFAEITVWEEGERAQVMQDIPSTSTDMAAMEKKRYGAPKARKLPVYQ
jgi:hypothetical protein